MNLHDQKVELELIGVMFCKPLLLSPQAPGYLLSKKKNNQPPSASSFAAAFCVTAITQGPWDKRSVLLLNELLDHQG